MVVPVRKSFNMEKVEECVGNNLKLKINHNKETLVVVGNNCKIQLSENSGLIRVVGNTCEVSVQKGNGNIEYVGNKGRIMIGSTVPEANVSYVGNNGVITNMHSSSSRKNSCNQDCNSRSNGFQDSQNFEVPNNFHISSCNNITISNKMGTETLPDTLPLNFSHFKLNRNKHQSTATTAKLSK